MSDRDYVRENEASRRELAELIARLEEPEFQCVVGSGWTVASLLCHLAFWDQRALFLLREWQRGQFEPSQLGSQTVDSINEAAKAIGDAVPGPAAAKLAMESAAASDSVVAGITDEFAQRIVWAGYERYLRRYLHRREHLEKIKEALNKRPAGAA